MKKIALLLTVFALGFVVWLNFFKKEPPPPPPPVEVQEPEPAPVFEVQPEPPKEKPKKKPKSKPKKKKPRPSVAAPPDMAPPKIEIHEELIPENIDIVRVYYTQQVTGPKSRIVFDINGTGFDERFERMITVESGTDTVAVTNLKLMTPNQIRGILEVSEKTKTAVYYPRVLIQKKVVFRAYQPFAVVRPGEVLNLQFIEIDQSGRRGRFRVITNLTQEMYSNFSVVPGTSSIYITQFRPNLPFEVYATINIGPAVLGNYGMAVKLGEEEIWSRDGLIRVVKPNVGQHGLIQNVQAPERYFRPRDSVKIIIQGSGFTRGDVTVLKAEIPNIKNATSSFTYVASGRLHLDFKLPKKVVPGNYGIRIYSGETVVQDMKNMIVVVGKNWVRKLELTPALVPGGNSKLRLIGRDLDKKFVKSLSVALDEPALLLQKFKRVNKNEASASIRAGATVRPGDYLLKITANGQPVTPTEGSIIRIQPK